MPEKRKAVEAKSHLIKVTDTCKVNDSITIERFSFNFDAEVLKNLTSGSCILGSTEDDKQPQKVAICKEGKTIKIFKIVDEKK
ncbi:MAG: hypothetical protein NWE95_09085 [Candidatus Bathyarchaeota archaeon]|nr:hypothetical protein [Candidatus Bathyarchaeota archaeon]